MAAAAHNPGFAKKAGIPMSVAKEFNQADKGTGKLKRERKMAKALAKDKAADKKNRIKEGSAKDKKIDKKKGLK